MDQELLLLKSSHHKLLHHKLSHHKLLLHKFNTESKSEDPLSEPLKLPETSQFKTQDQEFNTFHSKKPSLNMTPNRSPNIFLMKRNKPTIKLLNILLKTSHTPTLINMLITTQSKESKKELNIQLVKDK